MVKTNDPVSAEIDRILDGYPPKQRAALAKTREQIRELAPGAVETIDWKMPSFRIDGVILISYLGFQGHNSLFPGPEVLELMVKELASHQITKGTLHFELEKPLSRPLLKQLLRQRIQVINDSYPRANGEYKSFYDNGHLKSTGRYRDGQMTGHWKFFRRDGSIMREGKLQAGEPVGEWLTHPRPSVS
jgi:uncharacterized protein YdhG (YjbR/CyaY superfamily)